MAQVSSSQVRGGSSGGHRSLPTYLDEVPRSPTPLNLDKPVHVQHTSPKERQPRIKPSPIATQLPTASTMATQWSPSLPNEIIGCSAATLDNARYEPGKYPRVEHDNEDRYFKMDKESYQVFGVFDGHDGSRAVGFSSNYMMELFGMQSWKKVVGNKESDEQVSAVLFEFFRATERDFFKSISDDIERREVLTALIPQGMTSYQAQLNYPYEVFQLQQVEERINGGTTAVLAVIANKTLYVANVGDSRALIIKENGKGVLLAEQLSVDHGVDNEEELTRLEALGLNRESLKRSGRLGMHENTRSIGDYCIKGGYKDVDILASADGPPGSAIPHVAKPVPVDHTFRYLVLMTDGVYKSIEGMFQHDTSIEANKVLTGVIQNEDTKLDASNLADNVIARISKRHHETYQEAALKDPRSNLAVNCRKQDDMTCVIYKFPPIPRPRTNIPKLTSVSAPPSLDQQCM